MNNIEASMDILSILKEFHPHDYCPSAKRSKEILSNYPQFSDYTIEDCDDEDGGIKITFSEK